MSAVVVVVIVCRPSLLYGKKKINSSRSKVSGGEDDVQYAGHAKGSIGISEIFIVFNNQSQGDVRGH